eukprot:2773874-Amphidinium_carterae.1
MTRRSMDRHHPTTPTLVLHGLWVPPGPTEASTQIHGSNPRGSWQGAPAPPGTTSEGALLLLVEA